MAEFQYLRVARSAMHKANWSVMYFSVPKEFSEILIKGIEKEQLL